MKIKTTFTAPILAIAVILLLAGARFIDLDEFSYKDNIFLAVIVIELLVLIVPTAFYIRLRGEELTKRLKLRLFGPEKLIASLIAAATILSGEALLKLLFINIGLIDSNYSLWSSFLVGEETELLYKLIAFCIIPAVAEELLFRGVLCAEYEASGALTAALLSAGLYAMFGMNLGYFPVNFFCGVIYALVFFMTNSLPAAMLCHLSVSLAQLFFGETIWNIISKPQSTVFLTFALLLIFLVCLASLFSDCERIYSNLGYQNMQKPDASPQTVRGFAEALFAPPFLIAAIVFIIGSLQM